jgi:NADH-quinone oxidoreductase subunit J
MSNIAPEALVLYGLYAAIIVVGGLAAVLSKSLIRALVGLIATLFGVAGMYILMNAPFLALMQLLIYVGAVVVLIFFAIMLTKEEQGEGEPEATGGRNFLSAVTGGFVAVVLTISVLKTPAKLTGDPEVTPIVDLGKLLMTDFVLAFELISVVLLIAMAGAVLLGWERRKQAK